MTLLEQFLQEYSIKESRYVYHMGPFGIRKFKPSTNYYYDNIEDGDEDYGYIDALNTSKPVSVTFFSADAAYLECNREKFADLSKFGAGSENNKELLKWQRKNNTLYKCEVVTKPVLFSLECEEHRNILVDHFVQRDKAPRKAIEAYFKRFAKKMNAFVLEQSDVTNCIKDSGFFDGFYTTDMDLISEKKDYNIALFEPNKFVKIVSTS